MGRHVWVGLCVTMGVLGCGASAPLPAETSDTPSTPVLAPSEVAGQRAWTGPDGLLIQVVDLTDGGALLRATGVQSEVAGKVFRCDRKEDGSYLRYLTSLHGRPWSLLMREDSRWGGDPTWTSFVPGAPRDGFSVHYDAEATAAIDVQGLYAAHVAQQASGELEALARFDRPVEQQEEQAQLNARAARTAETCGSPIEMRIEWSTVSDEQLMDKSVSGFCGNLLSGLDNVCRYEAGKAFARAHARRAVCRLDGTAELSVNDGALTWAISFDTVNLHERAREALEAMQLSGDTESLGARILVERTSVCADEGSQHVVLLGPPESSFGGLAYGANGTYHRMFAPRGLGEGWFFEPRRRNEKNNENFRGYDLRFYSHVDVDTKADTCTLTCGSEVTQLTRLTGAAKAKILAEAVFEPSPQDREPYALARDKQGFYYYVDRGRTQETAKNFRLYRGKRGRLKRLDMRDVVSDSEGEIFESADGKLRLFLGREDAEWIVPKHKRELVQLSLAENYGLIYNELGVYLGKRLGVPCDDF